MSYKTNEIKEISRLIPLVAANQVMRDILHYEFTTFSLVRASIDDLKKVYVKQALKKFRGCTK